MLSGPNVILTLKIAVAAVTVIFVAALVAIALGKQRLHGRLNTAVLHSHARRGAWTRISHPICRSHDVRVLHRGRSPHDGVAFILFDSLRDPATGDVPFRLDASAKTAHPARQPVCLLLDRHLRDGDFLPAERHAMSDATPGNPADSAANRRSLALRRRVALDRPAGPRDHPQPAGGAVSPDYRRPESRLSAAGPALFHPKRRPGMFAGAQAAIPGRDRAAGRFAARGPADSARPRCAGPGRLSPTGDPLRDRRPARRRFANPVAAPGKAWAGRPRREAGPIGQRRRIPHHAAIPRSCLASAASTTCRKPATSSKSEPAIFRT